MKINMNQKVKVKLTDYGYKCLKEYVKDFYSGLSNDYLYTKQMEQFMQVYTNKEDVDGYLDFQLWEIFQYFGEFHYLGMPKTIFENNEIIVLEDN